jgi:hypothetical protein
MKNLITICLLLFLVVTGNAQEKSKSKYSELNQDQLNLALTKSKRTIKIGKILTYSGLGFTSIGWVLPFSDFGKHDDNTDATAAAADFFFTAGLITMSIGIPVWIVGATKKRNITLELVKFYPPGSASINGIGLNIRF